MKRIRGICVSIIICVILLFVLTGCSFNENNSNKNNKETNNIINGEAESQKKYKEVTVEKFKKVANKNGYTILDNSYYDNVEQHETMEEVSDYAIAFYTDEDGALEFKVEFYELKKQEELDNYYTQAIESLKSWNDEEKTIKDDIGNNYKKCEITNKYGYGVVINVGNTLFISYGHKEQLTKLIDELYK